MANRQSATPKKAQPKRGKKKQTGRGTSQNGRAKEPATYEQKLAQYLQERIKPGLNRGAIPLLARSIAKEVAQQRPGEDAGGAAEPDNEEDDDVRNKVKDDVDEVEDEDVRGEADEEFDEVEDEDVRGEADEEFDEEEDDDVRGEADDEFTDEEDSPEGSIEDELRDLQADLGDDWILRFSIQGENTWLTAEKEDGSQHVEAPAADVLADVVELLNESGGRPS